MSLLQSLQDAFGFGDRGDRPSADQFNSYPLGDLHPLPDQAYYSHDDAQDVYAVGTRTTPSPSFRESPVTRNPGANPSTSPGSVEIVLMKLRSFAEAPEAIATLRDQRSVILDLSLMDADQAQRCVDYVAGGVFAIDGQQHRLSTSVFLFTPGFVQVSGYSTATSNWSASDELEMYSFSTATREPSAKAAKPDAVLTSESALHSSNPFNMDLREF